LSPKSKQQLLTIIDTFIEAEALKQRSARWGEGSQQGARIHEVQEIA
jgi:predicted XRE-type DNA-binding protein